MSAKTEKLLALYKDYEGPVSGAGEDVQQAEDALPELESNQIRITRQMENFLSHNHAPDLSNPRTRCLRSLSRR